MTLAALLALQDHDTSIDQARHRRAHLPEATTVRELTQGLAALTARRAALAAQQEELGGRQAALDVDITASRSKQAELAKRLAATSVPREAQTFQHELDTARQRQHDLEDGELELMEALEPIDTEAASLDERITVTEAELAGAREALVAREAEVDAELAELTTARAPLAGVIDADTLAAYDTKRAKLGGIAVARLVHGTCSGCNIQLSSSEIQQMHHLPPEEPAECESCGRMLLVQ
jgi:predicted  nucleic acid-binding Zn-ribbon protein